VTFFSTRGWPRSPFTFPGFCWKEVYQPLPLSCGTCSVPLFFRGPPELSQPFAVRWWADVFSLSGLCSRWILFLVLPNIRAKEFLVYFTSSSFFSALGPDFPAFFWWLFFFFLWPFPTCILSFSPPIFIVLSFPTPFYSLFAARWMKNLFLYFFPLFLTFCQAFCVFNGFTPWRAFFFSHGHDFFPFPQPVGVVRFTCHFPPSPSSRFLSLLSLFSFARFASLGFFFPVAINTLRCLDDFGDVQVPFFQSGPPIFSLFCHLAKLSVTSQVFFSVQEGLVMLGQACSQLLPGFFRRDCLVVKKPPFQFSSAPFFLLYFHRRGIRFDPSTPI